MRKPGKPSLWAGPGSGRRRRPEPPAGEPLRSKADALAGREEVVVTKTVEKHRRLILRRAQQYRSFLINTNRRVVGVSLAVLLVAASGFGGLVYFNLYRDQSHSDFSYNVARILPLPVAKTGSTFVPYGDYLGDLRRQIHYFESQQGMDFSQPEEEDAQVTLDELKNASMKRVIDRVYVSKLAAERGLSVTEGEIDSRLALLQSQGKLGGNLEDIEEVLDNFWGLSLAEYRRILSANILQEKVTRAMDEELGNGAMERMEAIFRSLNGGEDFAELAIAYSEDPTTAINGGRYEFPLELEGREEDPQVLRAVFETPPGQFSDIVDTGDRLEVVKVLEDEGNGRRRAAHIRISYLLLDDILAEIRDKEPTAIYIDDVTYSVF